MHIVFFSTSNVFKAEELLLDAGFSCEVVPTPVQDKAYCGVCLRIQNRKALSVLKHLEYEVIEEN